MKIPLKEYFELLVNYLKPQWFRILILTVLLLIGTGLQLLNPQVIRYFIDAAQANAPIQVLIWAAVIFVSITLLQQFASILSIYISENVSWTATNRLRADLVRHVLQLDLSFHSIYTPGEFIGRIDSDVTKLANFFSDFVIRLLVGFLLLLGVLILLLLEDWRLFLFFGTFAVIYMVSHTYAQNYSVPYWRKERQISARLFGFLGEWISGLKDIQTSGGVAYVTRYFHKIMRNLFWTRLKADIITDVGWTVSNTVYALGYTGTLAVGVYLFQEETITIGMVYLIVHYLHMLRRPLNEISSQVENLQKARANIERVKALAETHREIQDGPGFMLTQKPVLVEFENVSFSYHPSKPVLRDISFRLQPGRVMGLLGHTGSGKTTLSRLLLRLYDVNEGIIRLDRKDIRQARLSDLRHVIGVVTQDVQLFQASIRDNLTLFNPQIDDNQILSGFQELGLYEWYQSLPEGLDTRLSADGGKLSAGQAQLLAFTRIFLKDPVLVILDEASSRLDPATEHFIDRAIERLLKNRTAIIIAHRLSTIQRADEILILEKGRIKEQGEYQILVEDPKSFFSHLLKTGLEEVLN